MTTPTTTAVGPIPEPTGPGPGPDTTTIAASAVEQPVPAAQVLYGSRVPVGEMVLITLLSFVDVILLKDFADVVVNDNSGGGILSWIMAVGVSGIGLVVAAGAGMIRHEATPGYKATLFAWLMIGVTVAALRALVGVFTGDGVELTDVALAALMLFLYIAAGWRMATLAPEVFHPGRRELAAAQRVRDRVTGRRRARLEMRYTQRFQAARRCDDARVQVDKDLEHVERQILAYRDRLYALARNEMSQALVDPAATTDINRRPVAERHLGPGHPAVDG